MRSSDADRARELAAGTPQLRVLPGDELRPQDEQTLLVRGGVSALDELVVRLVAAGIAVRELAPVVAPLEAAFLALTSAEQEQSG